MIFKYLVISAILMGIGSLVILVDYRDLKKFKKNKNEFGKITYFILDLLRPRALFMGVFLIIISLLFLGSGLKWW